MNCKPFISSDSYDVKKRLFVCLAPFSYQDFKNSYVGCIILGRRQKGFIERLACMGDIQLHEYDPYALSRSVDS